MKISFNWLKQYIPSEVEISELVEILTNTGLEVSSIERVDRYPGGLEGLIVGEVMQVEKHPNADRLSVTKVNVGNGDLKSIVCGAPNVAVGQKVVVALPGTTLYPLNGESFKINKGKIRGEISEGMICAEDEIGIGHSHDGIIVLEKKAKVGVSMREHLNLKEDYTIEIELTPNRTDAISHFGVARDYLAVKNLQPGNKNLKITIPSVDAFKVDNNDLKIQVDIKDKEACPRYSGVSMTEVKVGPSPDWLKERLMVIGLKPINNIVDAANFVMYETGQPMHVFDTAAIQGNIVVIRKPNKGTKFLTLDGVERELSGDDLMICNANEAMCIAGVFGGLNSGVKETTTKIFIESAYFEPSGIRRTARFHGLSTDASYRYERGANPEATIYALKRLAVLIQEIAGGKVSSEMADVYPTEIVRVELSLRLSYLKAITGTDIAKEEVRNILNSLDFDILTEDNAAMKLRVPGYRCDVTREIDVVEEVLRIHGFNNVPIPEKMSSSMSFRPKIEKNKLRNTISNMLASQGFREIMNNSLTSSSVIEKSGFIKVKNPLSAELEGLRTTLVDGGLTTIRYNLNRNADDLRLFEFGTVYRSVNGSFEEKHQLCIWISGSNIKESWREKQRHVNFFDIKESAEMVLKRMGINPQQLKLVEEKSEVEDYGISYQLGNKTLVKLSKVDEKILKKFDIEQEVYTADFDWDLLLEQFKGNPIKFEALPKFPSMRRDLALMLDDTVKYNEIDAIARETEKKILKEVNLFDVYTGKGVEPGKKSYAVSFTFQDAEKTLTDDRVDGIMEKLISKYKSELGASLR